MLVFRNSPLPALTVALVVLLGIPDTALGRSATPSTGFGLGAVRIPGAEQQLDRTKGLRFGRSVFHAGLSLETGWDSNVFYSTNSETSSAYIRLAPRLSLGTALDSKSAPPFVMYNLGLGMDYVGYLQDIGGVENARHQIGASVGGQVLINSQGAFRFGLVEQFTRTNEPRAGVAFGYNRLYNSVGFDFVMNPSRGLITILLGYRFVVDYFEDPYELTRANELMAFNALRHEVKVKATWRFFPLTSFWLQVDTGYNDYLRDFNLANVGTREGGNRDSVPLRVMLGVTGRLTPKLTADLGIGYRAFFYTNKVADRYPDNPNIKDERHDVSAHAALSWEIAPFAKLGLGYQRDVHDSIVGDAYVADSLYLTGVVSLFQRLELSVTFGWTQADYKGLFYADTTGDNCRLVGTSDVSLCERKDNYLLGSVNASYYFLSWLSAGLGYQLLANVSDFDTVYTGSGEPVVQQPSFFKHRVFASVMVYY